MSDVQIERIDEVQHYTGPHELEGIRFRPLAGALGVTAWGMNVLEMAPGAATYPEHDHSGDGQEEVFVVLSGEAVLVTGGEDRTVEVGQAVRIGPGVRRSWKPGSEGVKLLAIGATPGKAYAPPA